MSNGGQGVRIFVGGRVSMSMTTDGFKGFKGPKDVRGSPLHSFNTHVWCEHVPQHFNSRSVGCTLYDTTEMADSISYTKEAHVHIGKYWIF